VSDGKNPRPHPEEGPSAETRLARASLKRPFFAGNLGTLNEENTK